MRAAICGGSAGSGGSTVSSGGATGGTTEMCYVDFPCSYPYRCTATGYQPVTTHDCHHACGPGPCSGGTCDRDGSEIACPAGTRCVDGASDTSRACQPIDAGTDGAGDSGAKDTATVDAGDAGAKDAAADLVASCLDAGQNCADPTTSCCEGTDCVSANGGSAYSCRAVPACAAIANACSATTDCCAGLDCTGGKCVARADACWEAPEDGVCGGASTGTCCPGTVCASVSPSTLGCAIPSSTKPQDYTCPRDKPSHHEACSAARFGLSCTYSDWANEPGIFYTCTCSYHGWSCIKGYYV